VRAATAVGIASVVGVQAGVLAAEALPENLLQRLFGALLLVSAVQIAWRARRRS
jgi:uncharacterized membrane protein YfcA